MIKDLNNIDPEAITALQELEAKRKRGEPIDPKALEALKAIELAGNLIDSIMSGRQVDLAYFKYASADLVKKMQGENTPPASKKVKKKRKLYFKDKD